MKKAYIQPEFDVLKLSSSEDILQSPEFSTEIKQDPDDLTPDYDQWS